MNGRVWSTAEVPASEQFCFWQEVVWDAFIPVSLARSDAGPFRGKVSGGRVGPLGLYRICAQAQSVARTPDLIQRRRGDVFFLNLPLTAGTSASQDGRSADLKPGDFIVVDSSRPFDLGFSCDFDQLSITIPEELLAPALASPSEVTATRVAGDTGIGAVVGAGLRELASQLETIDRATAQSMAYWLVGLVALTLGTSASSALSTPQRLLFQAAVDHIERCLGDPTLSAETVAARTGISVRYLRKLFAQRGSTFSHWVLERRLQRCYQDLVDPARKHSTITEIASSRGIPDAAYFSRAFKNRYQVTPRELRQTRARTLSEG